LLGRKTYSIEPSPKNRAGCQWIVKVYESFMSGGPKDGDKSLFCTAVLRGCNRQAEVAGITARCRRQRADHSIGKTVPPFNCKKTPFGDLSRRYTTIPLV